MLSFTQYHILVSMTECHEDCGSTTSSSYFLHWKVSAFPDTLDSLMVLSKILFPDDSKEWDGSHFVKSSLYEANMFNLSLQRNSSFKGIVHPPKM